MNAITSKKPQAPNNVLLFLALAAGSMQIGRCRGRQNGQPIFQLATGGYAPDVTHWAVADESQWQAIAGPPEPAPLHLVRHSATGNVALATFRPDGNGGGVWAGAYGGDVLRLQPDEIAVPPKVGGKSASAAGSAASDKS